MTITKSSQEPVTSFALMAKWIVGDQGKPEDSEKAGSGFLQRPIDTHIMSKETNAAHRIGQLVRASQQQRESLRVACSNTCKLCQGPQKEPKRQVIVFESPVSPDEELDGQR